LKKPASFDDYTRFLFSVKPAIESLTDRKFNFERDNLHTNHVMCMKEEGFIEGQYEFMAHLRHNTFPSPLLDWSRSPYVALYFAFYEANESQSVAIYVYVEHLGRGKGGVVGAPEIVSLGHYIQSHKRHYIQQSEYTICLERKNKEWFYGSQKMKVLEKLDQMNINAFSLFGNEEGLMQMLAFRERGVFH
jgi:hypothetical protein